MDFTHRTLRVNKIKQHLIIHFSSQEAIQKQCVNVVCSLLYKAVSVVDLYIFILFIYSRKFHIFL